jgi:hypothetical protein
MVLELVLAFKRGASFASGAAVPIVTLADLRWAAFRLFFPRVCNHTPSVGAAGFGVERASDLARAFVPVVSEVEDVFPFWCFVEAKKRVLDDDSVLLFLNLRD